MYCTNKQFMKNPATAPSRIYVGGLPKTIIYLDKESSLPAIIADELEAKFSKHGKILGLVIQSNFAFIQYEYENEAQTAIRMENGTNMMERKITVRQALAGKDSGGRSQNQSKGPMQKTEAPNGNLEFEPPPAAQDCNMDVQEEETEDDRGRAQGAGGVLANSDNKKRIIKNKKSGGFQKGRQGQPRETGEQPGTSGASAAPRTVEDSGDRGEGSIKTGHPTNGSARAKPRRRSKRTKLAAGAAASSALKLPATSSSEGSGGGTPMAAGGKMAAVEVLRKAANTSRQPASRPAKSKGGTGTGDSTRGASAEGPRIILGLRGQETNLSSGDLQSFIETFNTFVYQYITRERGEETFPRVRAIRLWRGHILIVADNEETREWIRRELVNIRPWGLANLVEVAPERMRLLRAAIWIPGLKENVSTEALVRCLEAQNGLDCRLWRIRQRTNEERGSWVVMEVDEKSARAIRSRGSLLFCLASQVRVSLRALGECLTMPAEATGLKAAEESAAGELAATVGAAGSGGDPLAEGSLPEAHQMSEQHMEVDVGTSQEATGPTGSGPAGGL